MPISSQKREKACFLTKQAFCVPFGGDKRDRTADLLNAIQALSQLSYTPDSFRLSLEARVILSDGRAFVKGVWKFFWKNPNIQRVMLSKTCSTLRAARLIPRRIFFSLAFKRIPRQVPAAMPTTIPVQKLLQHIGSPPFHKFV